MGEFVELRPLLSYGATSDTHDAIDIGIEQAFVQNTLTHHSGRAEDKNPHVLLDPDWKLGELAWRPREATKMAG